MSTWSHGARAPVGQPQPGAPDSGGADPATGDEALRGMVVRLWDTPALFRLLPEHKRVTIARTVLGPSGPGGCAIVSRSHRRADQPPCPEATPQATVCGSPSTAPTKTMDVDHVIAGTGFHVDVAQLPFLPQDLLGRIPSAMGYPALSRAWRILPYPACTSRARWRRAAWGRPRGSSLVRTMPRPCSPSPWPSVPRRAGGGRRQLLPATRSNRLLCPPYANQWRTRRTSWQMRKQRPAYAA